MFFKTDIPQQHASFHMEHFSLTKAYDWADRVSTHSWPFLPLIQVNGLPWKTISDFCHLRRITHDKTLEEQNILAP